MTREKNFVERRSSVKQGDDDEDEGATWSLNSNGGLSRSSHDEEILFSNEQNLDDFSRSAMNVDENLQLINENSFYDGEEEILISSDDDDDEHFFFDDQRISLTREQLIEYQQLTKLLRFVKSGGRCTTILSLSLLQDFHLEDQCAFLAFKDSSTINVLLNFLEMADRDLKFNSLFVLRDASRNSSFAYEIFRLGGIRTIIESISFDHLGIEESCAILMKILHFRRARRVVRRCGGISQLICLFDELTDEFDVNHSTLKNLCDVFLLICSSEKNRFVSIRYGLGQILLKILFNPKKMFSTSIIALFALLLQIEIFRRQMLERNLIVSLMNLIDLSNVDFTRVLCQCFYYLSFNDDFSRHLSSEDLTIFHKILEHTNDSSIFSSISHIFTRFPRQMENLSDRILNNFIEFLKNSSDPSKILRSLNELSQSSRMIDLFKQKNIFPILLSSLNEENRIEVQLRILTILQNCAKDRSSAQILVDLHGFEQFWTLFKLASIPIRIAAGWTIRNCLQSIDTHGELIRSLDGVFYLILNCLSTDQIDLLIVTLAIVAEIARDQQNREILTDLGVVSKLTHLSSLENLHLAKPFCDALANLLDLPKNRPLFGTRRVMNILKIYFDQNHRELYRSLTKAMENLSEIPSNCVLMHDVAIDSNLLQLIADEDPLIQEHSANALRNLRQLIDTNRSNPPRVHFNHQMIDQRVQYPPLSKLTVT